MLDAAVNFLTGEVNAYLLLRTGSDFGSLQLGPLVDDKGVWTTPVDQLGLSLINVEEERALRAQAPERVLVNGMHVVLEPALKLNLLLLFSAPRFTKYDHALRYLSYVMTFFQRHPSFTPAEYPALDASVQKLSLELLTYGPEQLNQLWAYVGSKYVPSAVYRARLIVLQDSEPRGVEKPIMEVAGALGQR